ncbi:family A G protein-coupled receptor-like protein [Xylariaceae sp. FL0804]|nr:family A G protein-coupled receptor-like protein [Xylariaceae sp. FL0804]
MASTLTESQLGAISTIERVGSAFSICGCLLIIVTFLTSSNFHKPINRLVFYASFGNLMTNIAAIMAREFVSWQNSFGCQFQAFLIQMFLPADALWTLAMAFNVYLTFYFKFDAERLRKMEIYYLIACYGVPFIPALVFVFVSKPSAGRMYGDATLWCWIADDWDIFRVATFYAPVWVVILLIFFIYIRAGGEIYRKHRQLRAFGGSSSSGTYDRETLTTTDEPYPIKTTEINVTSQSVDLEEQGIDLSPLGRRASTASASEKKGGPAASASAAYSVTITSTPSSKAGGGPPPGGRPNRHSSSVHHPFPLPPSTTPAAMAVRTPVGPARPSLAPRTPRRAAARPSNDANNAAWQYTKCAILFFTALLVTWIPSTANRVYSLVLPGRVAVVLEVMSAIVLPLQGFWNALIYLVTSWAAAREFAADLLRSPRRGLRPVAFSSASAVPAARDNDAAVAAAAASATDGGVSDHHHHLHRHHTRNGSFSFKLASSSSRANPRGDLDSESTAELATRSSRSSDSSSGGCSNVDASSSSPSSGEEIKGQDDL